MLERSCDGSVERSGQVGTRMRLPYLVRVPVGAVLGVSPMLLRATAKPPFAKMGFFTVTKALLKEG